MGRRNRGVPIHGWLVIDKPPGLSSNNVVGRIRHATNAAKVGHGGTLDPLATGLLPLALGEATKTVSYAMDSKKGYRFTVCWGEARNTDDREGVITQVSNIRPKRDQISEILKKFIGEIEQTPPNFSAIKIGGKRAYNLARANKAIKLKSRTIQVEDFRLIRIIDDDHAEFQVLSGKGAYMRALARDVALSLGTVGHISSLRRISIGKFSEKDAIPLDNFLDKLNSLGHSAPLSEHLLPVETVLDDIPALNLTQPEARKLVRGQAVPVLPVARRSPLGDISHGEVICAMAEGRLVALAKIFGGEIRPFRVMNF
ncbi:MAG: tRNA pseudouridine(55) synthase TruB [Pseudomonadota bacterium]|nr:tRNA pseudouridine(55) synthase TruB [Pseudomonadota bacterium]